MIWNALLSRFEECLSRIVCEINTTGVLMFVQPFSHALEVVQLNGQAKLIFPCFNFSDLTILPNGQAPGGVRR